MNKIVIIIIIIVILIIISLFILNLLKSKNKTSGGSSSIIFDLMNNNLLKNELYNKERTTRLVKYFDKCHNDYLNYVLDYINTELIETDNGNINRFIVGDVHGSILQLFMPLRQAGILEKIELTWGINNYQFRYELSRNILTSKQVIYCGDFFGRARHSLTIAMIYTFINIYNEVNGISRDKIVWVFGNHDVGFIRKFIYGFDKSTYREHVYLHEVDEVEYDKLDNNNIDNNPYSCIYYDSDSNIMVSHTFMRTCQSTKLNYLNGIIAYFLNVYDIYNIFNPNLIDKFKTGMIDKIVETSIVNQLNNAITKHELTELKNNFNRLSNIEQVNYINDVAKYIVIKHPGIIAGYLEPSFYWTWLCKCLDETECESYKIHHADVYKFNDTDRKKFKHFVGHEIIDIYDIITRHQQAYTTAINADIHELHNNYIDNVYNSENVKEFNDKSKTIIDIYHNVNLLLAENIAKIIKFVNLSNNMQVIMVLALKYAQYNHMLNFSKYLSDTKQKEYIDYYIKFIFNDTDIVFTDIGSSLNFQNFYEEGISFGEYKKSLRDLANELQNYIKDVNKYSDDEFNNKLETMYGSVNVGSYVCLFFKVDLDNNIDLSKFYAF